MKFQITDLIIRSFLFVLKRFSRLSRQRFVNAIIPLVLKLAEKTRRRAFDNITNAMPHLTAQQADDLVFASYKVIAYGVLECFWLDELEIDIKCDENTLRLLNNPTGVSVATMHMSCYELAPLAINKIVGSVTTLSKLPKFMPSAAAIYQKANINVIDKNEPNSLFHLLGAARNGAAVCLHADHYSKEVDVTFFGRSTKAPSGSAIISAYSKVPLLLCYPVLNDDGRYTVYFETIVDSYVDNNPVAISQAINTIYKSFEAIILKHPTQWYWSYNRWRR